MFYARPRLIVHYLEDGDKFFELSGQTHDDPATLCRRELIVWGPYARADVVLDDNLGEVIATIKLKDIARGKIDMDRVLAGEPLDDIE
jgi:hypothetical protein